jgi:hypothetical protein
MTVLARASSNCKCRTRPLIQRGCPTSTNPHLTVTNLVFGPRWVLNTQTDWPVGQDSVRHSRIWMRTLVKVSSPPALPLLIDMRLNGSSVSTVIRLHRNVLHTTECEQCWCHRKYKIPTIKKNELLNFSRVQVNRFRVSAGCSKQNHSFYYVPTIPLMFILISATVMLPSVKSSTLWKKEKKRASFSWIHKHERSKNYPEGNRDGKLNSQINKASFESVWQLQRNRKENISFTAK